MSIRFQADNDLKFAIVKAVRRREPAIDFVSAQESGLDGVGDPDIRMRTASEGRVCTSRSVGMGGRPRLETISSPVDVIRQLVRAGGQFGLNSALNPQLLSTHINSQDIVRNSKCYVRELL